MTALVLTNYMSLGEQQSAGIFIDSTGNSPGVSGALSMEDAALISVSNAGIAAVQGERFYIKIVYADQQNVLLQPVFEIMEASYNLDNGVYKWEREATIASSNNGAAVDFQAAIGQPNLKIFGVTPDAIFGAIKQKESDVRIFQKKTIAVANVVQDSSSSTYIDACDRIIVTPVSLLSSIEIEIFGSMRVERDGTSGANYRGRLALSYINTSSVAVVSASILFGSFNGVSDPNHGQDAGVSVKTRWTPAQHNSNQDWEIAPQMLSVDAGTLVTMFTGVVTYTEYIE